VKSERNLASLTIMLVAIHFNIVYQTYLHDHSHAENKQLDIRDDKQLTQAFVFLMRRDSIVIIHEEDNLSDYKDLVCDDLMSPLLDHIKSDPQFQKLFLEFILRLIINPNCTREESLYCLLFVLDLMAILKSSLFSSIDMDTYLDYTIKRLQVTSSDVVREYLITILILIYMFSRYKLTHKRTMLEELLENYIESEEINDSLKKHCNKVLKIIKYIYCNTPPKRISFVYE
jgi:hypothetical protein